MTESDAKLDLLLTEAKKHLAAMEKGVWTSNEEKRAFAAFARRALPVFVKALEAGRLQEHTQRSGEGEA